jgi:hypothetical protein
LPARYGDDKGKTGPGPFPRALMAWVQADPNINMVDVHIHEAKPEDCLDVFNYARSFTSKPIIVTEWSPSESKRGMLSATIYEAARAFYDKYQERFKLTPKTTFEQFVRARYTDNCSKEEWDEFVALFDYDPLFWQKGFDLMNDPQMAILLYGQYLQGGTPIYDLKQIVANRTVVPKDGQPQLNYRFGEYFKTLTAHVRSLQK